MAGVHGLDCTKTTQWQMFMAHATVYKWLVFYARVHVGGVIQLLLCPTIMYKRDTRSIPLCR